jgi:hypothetical protein
MEDHRMFKVSVTTTDLEGNKLVYYTHVYATTKFHAIEKAVTRYRDIQPNREMYGIVSHWDRESGQTIALLAVAGLTYIANFPN